AAQPLLTITSLDTVWVLADVYEQDLGLVAPGAAVRIHVPAYPGESFPGTVRYIGDVVDSTTRTVKVRCIVPNPSGRLKPEMYAKVELESKSGYKVLTVSSRAVLRDGDKAKVVIATEGNRFRTRLVEVGPEV